MTKTLLRFSALAMLCLALACQKKLNKESTASGRTALSVETCDPVVTPLINSFSSYGDVAIWNDATNLYIKFTAAPGYLLKRASGLYGTYTHLVNVLADDFDETQGATPPDFTQTWAPEVQSYTFSFPVATAFSSGDCIWINVHAIIVQKDGSGNVIDTKYLWSGAGDYINSVGISRSFQFCKMNCIPPPPPPGDCGQLRTQTPGGWGAEPSGNNPGTYLHANFGGVFTNGLTVGCYPGGYYVKLTSAQAITDLLPTGGKAVALTTNYTNPPAMKNVLVGHLVALKLSAGFDANDPDFGDAGVTLGAMKIGSGTFAGWTVAQFITEADKVLGGCGGSHTPTQILETATAINENYVDGSVDNGFLVCPKTED